MCDTIGNVGSFSVDSFIFYDANKHGIQPEFLCSDRVDESHIVVVVRANSPFLPRSRIFRLFFMEFDVATCDIVIHSARIVFDWSMEEQEETINRKSIREQLPQADASYFF